MNRTSTDPGLVIEIERHFDSTPERLFALWTHADALARWFAPPGYTTLGASADAFPGGVWNLTFRSRDGHEYLEQGVFLTLDPPTRLEFTLTQVDGERENPETRVTVEFHDVGTPDAPRTRMLFRQAGYRSAVRREANAEGWSACFDALRRDVVDRPADEQAIRDLFAEWFDASERRDLEASIAPIADEIVSYEHETPQEYRGRDGVRQVCAAGFEYQVGDFRWDVPDLEIRVEGDLAVAWGLNRMRTVEAGGRVREQWSRGTRVFERRNGRWLMTHQHVSFPIDSDGRASMER